MKIQVEKPSEEKLKSLGVKDWPVWTKEKSRFDWEYGSQETCFILEGKVMVTLASGETAEFGKGDLVIFPKGLKCVWEVKEAVKKHYKFE